MNNPSPNTYTMRSSMGTGPKNALTYRAFETQGKYENGKTVKLMCIDATLTRPKMFVLFSSVVKVGGERELQNKQG